MSWKQEAVDRLRHYAARRASVAALEAQLQENRLRREGIRAARADGVAVAGGGCGREEMLLSSLVRQQELERRLEQAKSWVAAVEAALDALTEEERCILDRFYIHPYQGSVERLLDELCLERASVYRRKDKALRRFTMALYGWEEL